MERRLILAVVLMTAAILITNILFPPPERPDTVADSQLVEESVPSAASGAAPSLPVIPVTGGGADTVTVESELYRFQLSSRGGTVIGAELKEFASYSAEGERVQLVAPNSAGLFINRLVIAGDTIDLRTLNFAIDTTYVAVTDSAQTVAFSYADPSGFSVVLEYRFDPDSYLVDVSGRVGGLNGRQGYLLTNIGPALGVHEHRDHRSEQQFAVVTHAENSVTRLLFRKVEGVRPLGDELTWAGIKDKYFLVFALAGDRPPLRARVTDVPDVRRQVGPDPDDTIVLPQAVLSVDVPIAQDGTFSFGAFIGPQDYDRLGAIGYDLRGVTPYGYRFLEPVIRPFAALVMWILSGLHNTLGIAYGWVLAIFGVAMRIVLWPLNARAMRAQMKNMGFQPLITEIKEKYKDDPKKQQEAMLALYKEHGFNPFGGCLPMLVPFPVLITLFFVFQNTIAFRGAEFLWLPDLSLRDPLYILPVILMVSMFALQWVSAHLSGMEQNPQMKMMMYTMPIVMGVIFFALPSGLNLYYAVTQVASLPQQVLIARERKAAQEALKAAGPQLPSAPLGKRRGSANLGPRPKRP